MQKQRNGYTWALRGFEAGFVAGWLCENLLTRDYGIHVGGLFAAFLGGIVGFMASVVTFAVIVIQTNEYPAPSTFTDDQHVGSPD
ncbi:hypothetical protein Pan44_44710 [Caulifigura coniformis]|uniref:Uncharacterized protein n=1 Tax=Caulifigura coniformis TaxID=2527983 RepID=A0A517SJW9_9PLAN|nr:hypothetical protein [Caulifigura coniformis]QDT56417.1 hypothetical protein Pan44_44710 [Caulifigura coniformis]